MRRSKQLAIFDSNMSFFGCVQNLCVIISFVALYITQKYIYFFTFNLRRDLFPIVGRFPERRNPETYLFMQSCFTPLTQCGCFGISFSRNRLYIQVTRCAIFKNYISSYDFLIFRIKKNILLNQG
jgi:hypothetical protein